MIQRIMDMNRIYILCTILCVQIHFSIQQYLPSIPCPRMFQYQHDGKEWTGIAHIPASPVGQTTDTEISLSLPAQLPSQYVGSLELTGSRDAADQQIRSNHPVTYKIRFPLISPLPKLTKISVNGNVLCSGPPETGAYVTSLYLKHILFTVYPDDQLQANGYGNSINYKDYVIYYNQHNYNQQQLNQQLYTVPTQTVQVQPQYTPTTQAPIYVQEPQLQHPSIELQPPSPQYSQFNSQQSVSEINDKPHGPFQVTSLLLGSETTENDLSKIVAVNLKLATGLEFICGGDLKSNIIVVTPSHCFRTDAGISASDLIQMGGNIRSGVDQGLQKYTYK